MVVAVGGSLLFLVLVLVSIARLRNDRRKLQARQREIRMSVLEGRAIGAQEFLDDWKVGGRNARGGYRSMDQPGCYVILANPSSGDGGEPSWDAVYVGQSIHVCSRVRQHLTGHGNGDVYADVREGRDVKVRIVPCERGGLNGLERELVAAFDATASYNRTRGGAPTRE